MGLASYKIVGSGGEWRIQHDGRAENVFQTKEGTLEAALAAASLALRQGHEVGLPTNHSRDVHRRKQILLNVCKLGARADLGLGIAASVVSCRQ